MRKKLLLSYLAAAILLVLTCVACSQPPGQGSNNNPWEQVKAFANDLVGSLLPGQGTQYDPSKNYAAFLVLDNDTGRSSLATMKQRSTGEGFEIGPIEFYKQGAKDFAPVLQKLTASKQVTLVWIISSLWDIPEIKKGMEGLEYAGPFRYVPISEGTGAIKIQQ